MKILFVINNLYIKGNGLDASTRRVIQKLKERGEDVRVLSGMNPDPNGPQPDYALKIFHFPFFQKLIVKNGFSFAIADKKIIKEAIEWADVVHVEEAFVLEIKATKIAKKMHKAITASYHLHPENIFAALYLTKSILFNHGMLWIWKKWVFNRCQIIHCPTYNVYERLKRHHFKAELRVFSNGLVREELIQKTDENSSQKLSNAKYNVIAIGRYAREKNLKTLFKAMKYSKYGQEIQLIVAGKGPKEKSLRRRAEKLYKKGIIKYKPLFGFYKLDDLQNMSSTADLYVHCAYIEVEGLSCMEAIQIGLVPIIAKARYSATPQFAMNENSLYRRKDAKELAQRIDYWLDNDELRKKEAEKYVGIGKKYDIEYSINRLQEMFEDAYIENKKKYENK